MSVEIAEQHWTVRLRFSGLVTPAGIRGFVREAGPVLLPALAGYADFSEATIAAYAEHFTRPLDQRPEVMRLLAPFSICCNCDDALLFAEHARQAADLGVVRVIFSDPAPALAWTQEKASAARLARLAKLQGLHGSRSTG